MANVNDDDEETLQYADESEYMDDEPYGPYSTACDAGTCWNCCDGSCDCECHYEDGYGY